MSWTLGVDLGTTYSTAGVAVDGRLEMIGLGAHASAVPSAVFCGEDLTSVGDAAMVQGDAHPTRLAIEFKRQFGESAPLLVGDEFVTADDLNTTLGAWVFARACEREGGVPSNVVFTFPAFWGAFRRDAFLSLAREVVADRAAVSLVTEPEAAAAYYARRDRLPVDAKVGVYDFGGGTFDAAILQRTEHGFEVLGRPSGDDHLGGIDIDQALFWHVAQRAGLSRDQLDGDDARRIREATRLRRNVTTAKELLSEQPTTDVDVAVDGVITTVRITRRELEALAEPFIVQTLDVFDQALRYANVDAEELHSILLVGGASRMPRVAESLGERWRVPIALDSHPKFAVCLGAALSARHDPDVATPPAAPRAAPPAAPTAAPPAPTAPPAAPLIAESVSPPSEPYTSTPGASRINRRLIAAAVAVTVLAAVVVVAVSLRGSGSPTTTITIPPAAPATTPTTVATTALPPTTASPVVARLDANPATLTLQPGETKAIALTGTTDAGQPADPSLLTAPQWHSDNENVVTVAADGTVTAVAPGTATVIATVGNATAHVSVEVSAPPASTASATTKASTRTPPSGTGGGNKPPVTTASTPTVTPP